MLFTLKVRAIKLTFCDIGPPAAYPVTSLVALVSAADWARKDWDYILRFREPLLKSLVIVKRDDSKAYIKLTNVTSPHLPGLVTPFYGEPVYSVPLACRGIKFVGQTPEQWMVAPEEFPRLRMWAGDE